MGAGMLIDFVLFGVAVACPLALVGDAIARRLAASDKWVSQ